MNFRLSNMSTVKNKRADNPTLLSDNAGVALFR